MADEQSEQRPAEPAFLEDLRWLRGSLGVSMSEIAELFGVTRKAVYDWFNGSAPKRVGRIAKIQWVRSALEGQLSAERLRLIRHVWEQPLEGGSCLWEQLRLSAAGASEAAAIARSLGLLEGPLREIERRQARFSDSPSPLGEAHAEDLIRSL